MPHNIMSIAHLADAGDLNEMLEEALETRFNNVEIEITDTMKHGNGRTISYGFGKFTSKDTDDQMEHYKMRFEINVGTHKDAVLVFDPLEVVIEVSSHE